MIPLLVDQLINNSIVKQFSNIVFQKRNSILAGLYKLQKRDHEFGKRCQIKSPKAYPR